MARQLQEILDSGELTGLVIPKVKFTPQINNPIEEEGLFFYQSESKTHVSKNNIPGVGLNIGQEQYIHVINKTGSTILNGAAVRYGTTDIATGLPTIELASAALFSTARVGGIATHLIDVDQEGIITTFGKVGGLDTTGLAIGETLFLSETTPGSYQLSAPDIATRVGAVLTSDSADGTLFVNIENITAIPPVIAFMNHGTLPATIDGTWATLNNYTVSASVVMEFNPVAGTITVPIDGIVRANMTISLDYSADAAKRTFYIQLWDVTDGVEIFNAPTRLLKDFETYDFSTSAPFMGYGGHEYSIRVQSPDSDTNNVIVLYSTFDIQSIHIR